MLTRLTHLGIGGSKTNPLSKYPLDHLTTYMVYFLYLAQVSMKTTRPQLFYYLMEHTRKNVFTELIFLKNFAS